MDDPVLRVQSQLTGRDRVLLGWLYDHGVLTSFQIANALFPSLDFCQRRLRTLYRLRLVARFRPQRADGGSYPYHYVIDQLGAEVVAANRDERPPRRDHARMERRRWTSTRSLAHRLGVNGFFTDLAGHARTHPDAELVEWLPEAVCQRAGTFTSRQDPGLVRAYQPRVRPDGYGRWVDGRRRGAVLRRVRHRRRAAVDPRRQAGRLSGAVRHARAGVAGAVLAALGRPGAQPAPRAGRRPAVGAGGYRCPRPRRARPAWAQRRRCGPWPAGKGSGCGWLIWPGTSLTSPARRVRPRDWRRHDGGGQYLRRGSDSNGRRLSRICPERHGRC